MNDWTYYTFDENSGCLFDDCGEIDIYGADGKPIIFYDASAAERYLVKNDIRGSVR